jgi:glycosyltransferase involved in cell wall biosynthesis
MKRVAIVHDWLTGMRGGERVLEHLLDLFPEAELFTLLHVPRSVSPRIEARPIHTSFVNKLPGIRRWYRYYLPLFPRAVEALDIRGFDLVLSVSHCVAKGVRVVDGRHVSYCLTPMRYAWDLYDDYFGSGRVGPLMRVALPPVLERLRRWDAQSCERVDRFVTISKHVQGKIDRFYRRSAGVVYPPIDTRRFRWDRAREDFYLVVSALVPYKRVDRAIEAFRSTGRRLVVVGKGPDLERLRRTAPHNVTFLGWRPDEEVADLMERCRALVFPGEEDFGLVPLEAQAAGAPVIALSSGGALETVISTSDGNGHGHHDPTGVFFERPDSAALQDAIIRFEGETFDPQAARRNAERFSIASFNEGMRAATETGT